MYPNPPNTLAPPKYDPGMTSLLLSIFKPTFEMCYIKCLMHFRHPINVKCSLQLYRDGKGRISESTDGELLCSDIVGPGIQAAKVNAVQVREG